MHLKYWFFISENIWNPMQKLHEEFLILVRMTQKSNPRKKNMQQTLKWKYIRKGKYTLRIKSAHWFIIPLCGFFENAFLCFLHIWNKSVYKFNCFMMCTHMQQKIMLTNFSRWQFNFVSIKLYYWHYVMNVYNINSLYV